MNIHLSADVPPLVRELLKKAAQLGITEEALCHRLAISHSHFSRWRTGLRSAPDPRNSDNRKFYVNAAEVLGKTIGEVLAYVIFPNSAEQQNLEDWIFDSVINKKKSIPIPVLSDASQKLLHSLVVNVPGREEFLSVLIANFKTYVRDVLHDEWFEDATSAVPHYRSLNQQYRAGYRIQLTEPDADKQRQTS